MKLEKGRSDFFVAIFHFVQACSVGDQSRFGKTYSSRDNIITLIFTARGTKSVVE